MSQLLTQRRHSATASG